MEIFPFSKFRGPITDILNLKDQIEIAFIDTIYIWFNQKFNWLMLRSAQIVVVEYEETCVCVCVCVLCFYAPACDVGYNRNIR